MTKKSNPGKATSPEMEAAMVPHYMAWLGPVIAVAGLFLMQRANRAQPGTMDMVWYLGLVLAIAGVLAWLTSGMNRDQVLEWLRGGVIALGCALMIRWAIAEPYRIPSASMERTLHGDPGFGRGDRVFVNKWIYGVRAPFMNKRLYHGVAPKRWDIIVFKTPEKNALHSTLVKRIVGLPGERIQVKDGKITVNGATVEVPPDVKAEECLGTRLGGWINPLLPSFGERESERDSREARPFAYTQDGNFGVWPADDFSVVPQGHYLVMGDNSAHSRDGRYFGWLPNENIVGRVACIWWPIVRWRDFTGFSQSLWWRVTVGGLLLFTLFRFFVGRFWNSWDGGQRRYRYVLFLAYGVRMPLTRFWLARWGRPRRGELVLCIGPATEDGQENYVFGRIAGLPGERVLVRDGRLLINDREEGLPACLADARFGEAPPEAVYGRSKAKETTVVPDRAYFVLAEAKGAAPMPDSRLLGWIAEANVLGRSRG